MDHKRHMFAFENILKLFYQIIVFFVSKGKQTGIMFYNFSVYTVVRPVIYQ